MKWPFITGNVIVKRFTNFKSHKIGLEKPTIYFQLFFDLHLVYTSTAAFMRCQFNGIDDQVNGNKSVKSIEALECEFNRIPITV